MKKHFIKRVLTLGTTALASFAVAYLTRHTFFYPVPLIALFISGESAIRIVVESIHEARRNG